jgi:hypothetical protein
VGGLDVVGEAVAVSVSVATLRQFHKLPLPTAVDRRGLLPEVLGGPQLLMGRPNPLEVEFEDVVVQ